MLIHKEEKQFTFSLAYQINRHYIPQVSHLDKLLYNFVYSPQILPLRGSLSFWYRTGAVLFTNRGYLHLPVASLILNIQAATDLMLVVYGILPIVHI